jgi:outer membrane receptor protein involved in Fe transport
MRLHLHARGLRTAALITGLSALAAGGPALAQSPPQTAKPDTAPADTPGKDVTITGQKASGRIDRHVYDNTKDPDSQTGTAADALSKVPGVTVDPNGNVTVRGRPAQILINGRPSLLLQGDNRASALQAMPSSYISSIEVIANPGAQYSSEGSGGLINIVTKPKVPPGGFGSINGHLTSTGGYRSNLFKAMQAGKLTVIGVVGFSHGRNLGNSSAILERRGPAGVLLALTQQEGTLETVNDSPSLFGGAEYALTPDDTLSGQIGFVRNAARRTTDNRYGGYDGLGATTDLYTRHSDSDEISENQSASLTWTHLGKRPDQALKVHGSLSRVISVKTPDHINSYSLSSVPGNIGTRIDSKRQANDVKNGTFSIDYNTPVGDDQLTAGIQITHDDSMATNLALGPDSAGAPPTVNPLLTSAFAYDQTISAAYFTYQRQFGDRWTVLGGLRSETLDLDTNRVTSQTTSHVNYTKLNPSLFATYVLSPTAKVRLRYSHRLQRPGPAELNPFVTYVDAQNVSAGNPDLMPQETDAFEIGYEYASKALSYWILGFYRRSDTAFYSVSTFVPDPQNAGNQVLLTTRRNGGVNTSGGLDFNVSKKLGAKWSFSANGTLSATRLQSPVITGVQAATSFSGRMSLTYAAANKDRFQFSYNATGKQLTGQGYSLPYGQAQIQYSRNLTPRLSMVVVANDVLRTGKYTTVIDTLAVRNVVTTSRVAPTFTVTLAQQLGGARPSAAQKSN